MPDNKKLDQAEYNFLQLTAFLEAKGSFFWLRGDTPRLAAGDLYF
ncbi:MAG: hypothetical protein K0S74_1152 [Chlamydiales bacterium]|jgi:hypothetical protein|nr:hypothetical protein [Chlamydiales bacterium]